MENVLISVTKIDPSTNSASQHVGSVVDEAIKLGYNVFYLENAKPETIRHYAQISDFVYHIGHGCGSIATGFGFQDVFWTKGVCYGRSGKHEHNDSNVEILAGKKVFLISCWAGKELAPAIWSSGASVTGFTKDIVWVFPNSKYFFDAINSYFIELLRGRGEYEAYSVAYSKFNEAIAKFEKNKDWLSQMTVKLLVYDRDSMVSFFGGNVIANVFV